MNKLRLDVNFTLQRKYISRASVVSISKNQIHSTLFYRQIGPAECAITFAGIICRVHCRWGMVVFAPHSSRQNEGALIK